MSNIAVIFSVDLNQQREDLSSLPEKMDSRAALESILIVFISIVFISLSLINDSRVAPNR